MNQLATAIHRPEPGEYAPYCEKYVAQITGNDIVSTLDEQCRQMVSLLSRLSEADGDLRYAPEKWSLKGVVGHVCDAERIFAYRALRIARNDPSPLAGFDENDYAKNAPFERRPLANVIEDYRAVRSATLTLFSNLDAAAWTRRGVANQQPVTVRALAYIIAGHELHHRRIVEEKYLGNRR